MERAPIQFILPLITPIKYLVLQPLLQVFLQQKLESSSDVVIIKVPAIPLLMLSNLLLGTEPIFLSVNHKELEISKFMYSVLQVAME